MAARARRTAAVRSSVSSARSGGSPLGGPPLFRSPRDNELDVTLQQAIMHIDQGDRPVNTAKAMDPKKEEWMQFCDHVYPEDPYRYIITSD